MIDHSNPPFLRELHKAYYIYDMARRRPGVKPETLDRMYRDLRVVCSRFANPEKKACDEAKDAQQAYIQTKLRTG